MATNKEVLLNSKYANRRQQAAIISWGEERRSDSSKVDKETQTIYCKYSLNAKIESMVAKNDTKRDTVSLSQTNEKNTEVHLSPMSATVNLKDRKKCKYFIGLDPSQFEALFRLLGEAKYNLLYWN